MTTTETKQWTCTAGPRQRKKAVAALKELDTTKKMYRELNGVRGGDESSCLLWSPFGGAQNTRAIELWQELGDKYDWTLTAENREAVEKDAYAAIKIAKAEAPVNDARRDPPTADEIAERNQREAEQEAKENVLKDSIERIIAKAPAGAKAVIIAERRVDQSDPMTDYFHASTAESAAIGWRFTERENFNRLREAAATFEHTKHLGPGCNLFCPVALYETPHGERQIPPSHVAAMVETDEIDHRIPNFATLAEAQAFIDRLKPLPDAYNDNEGVIGKTRWDIRENSVEHRDNYRGGDGNYLMASGPYSSGWRVRSVPIGSLRSWWRCELQDALPDQTAVETPSVTGAGYTIEKHFHTKRQVDMYIVVLDSHVDTDDFKALSASCRSAGGWYSRKWGSTPGGFAFTSQEAASAWAESALG